MLICDDRRLEMVAETETVRVLDVQYRCGVVGKGNNNNNSTDLYDSDVKVEFEVDVNSPNDASNVPVESDILQFTPLYSFRFMEDEHIRIDNLSSYLGSAVRCPSPSAFYGVFDGHGGPDAAAYIKKNAMRFFFEDADFSQTSESNDVALDEVEDSFRRAFLLADVALADDCSVSSSSGTTALTALILGRPIYPSERQRVMDLGGYIDDGYLNGVLSPEFQQTVLTEDYEFLIIGCDGIWDVMTSQDAVSIVRRELVMEALRKNTFDNLTVIVICFSPLDHRESSPIPKQQKVTCVSLSEEALCSLKKLLDNNGGGVDCKYS
ncbi:hypothetical protein MKW92_036790 [Papaver armeniacum]|nr:hypothetical protein MKW92_036790 [Papaver armeniacum]